jgi:hypothetical protein
MGSQHEPQGIIKIKCPLEDLMLQSGVPENSRILGRSTIYTDKQYRTFYNRWERLFGWEI